MPSPIAHAVTGYCLGSIWPEVFTTNIRNRSKQRLFVGIAILTAIAADFDFLPQLVSETSFHRGITHSLGFAIIFSLALAGLLNRRSRSDILSAFSLGFISYTSHLLMDLLTTGGRGIPLFWPLSSYLVQSPITIFPQVHHSEGLFYAGHIPVLVFEAGFALLLVLFTRFYLRFNRFKNLRHKGEGSV